MYRLLLIAQPTEATDHAFWKAQNFHPVEIASDFDAAVSCLASHAYDAVGVPDQETYDHLTALLRAKNDGIPAFILPADPESSHAVIRDVKHLLNRLHVDYIDEQYSLNELSAMIQYEMLHNLLSGVSQDAERLYRSEDVEEQLEVLLVCGLHLFFEAVEHLGERDSPVARVATVCR